MTAVCLMLAVLLAAVTRSAAASDSECGSDLMVDIRTVPLAEHERIVGIELTVVSGQIVGVERIPDDWGVSVSPEVGSEASLSGNVGHGAGALDSADELPVVIIRTGACDRSDRHFAVKAAVHVTRDFESSRRIKLRQSDLRIRRASGSALSLKYSPKAGGSADAPASGR